MMQKQTPERLTPVPQTSRMAEEKPSKGQFLASQLSLLVLFKKFKQYPQVSDPPRDTTGTKSGCP